MRYGGSIYERPTGVWWARLRFTDEDGRKRERKRRAASRREAADRLRDLYQLLDEEEAAAEAERRRPKTFDDLVDLYEREYLGELRSRSSAEAHLKRLVASPLSGRLLRSISYGEISDLRHTLLGERLRIRDRDGRPRTRSLVSANRILSLLRRLLNLAVRLRWISRNPMDDGKPLVTTRREGHRDRVLSIEEERRLLGAVRDDELRSRIVLAVETGLRAGELRSLRWDDVGVDVLFVAPAKTDASRIVPLTDRARSALALLPRDGERVFSIADPKKAWASALRRAGVEDFRFHDLRHTFASRAIERGVPIAETQILLGHRSASMTFRYLALDRRSISRLREMLQKREKDLGDLVAIGSRAEDDDEAIDSVFRSARHRNVER